MQASKSLETFKSRNLGTVPLRGTELTITTERVLITRRVGMPFLYFFMAQLATTISLT